MNYISTRYTSKGHYKILLVMIKVFLCVLTLHLGALTAVRCVIGDVTIYDVIVYDVIMCVTD